MARVKVQVPIEQNEVEHDQQYGSSRRSPRGYLSNRDKRKTLAAVAILAVIIIIAALLNNQRHLNQQISKLNSNQNSSTDQNQKYQDDVARLVNVPEGVKPQVKVPTDTELAQLVKENSIYKNTQSGDVFLVYTTSENNLFVVIYRPSSQKVILATQASQSPAQTTKK